MNVLKVQKRFAYFGTRLLIGIIFLVGFLAVEIMLNETWYNPAVIVPIFGWAHQHGLGKIDVAMQTMLGIPDDRSYRLISISTLNNSQWFKARAAVIGVVTDAVSVSDGDWHLNVKDEEGNVLVAEISPELPVPVPPLHVPIRLWGITRYDLGHRWWEIHPVIGWEAVRN